MKRFKLNEKQLHKVIKNIVKEAVQSYWDEEELPEYSKEDEINASWDAFENTFNQEQNGNLPTRLGGDWEKTNYRWGKENYEDAFDYNDDYPNAFTEDDEEFPGWNAMNAMNDEEPLFAQHFKQQWKGKADKNNNLTWKVDFDNIVDCVVTRVKNKLIK